MALGALVLLTACMPTLGWQRTDKRACEPQSPPILCLAAQEDAGLHELRVGERVILPGECLVGPADQGGGRLAVSVRVSSGEEVARSHVRVKAGVRTTVRVQGERPRVHVVDEQPCDDRVPAP